MPLHNEKLTVYQRALEFATWSQDLIESLTKKPPLAITWNRRATALRSISLKEIGSSRRKTRFFQIAHGCLQCWTSWVAESPKIQALMPIEQT